MCNPSGSICPTREWDLAAASTGLQLSLWRELCWEKGPMSPEGTKREKTALGTTLQCSYEMSTTGYLAKQWAWNEEKENHFYSNITHQKPIASPPRGLISRHQCNHDTEQYSLILTASLLRNAWDLQLVRGAGPNLLPHHFSQELVAAPKPRVSSPVGDNSHLPITLVES